mmetsp:Transcript_6847/g.14065  ORF Transcript_6847/g.14065 Transcript_6847/m.14065 type:complete len:252 (-) Transcript_6847:749-1504(-)
MYIGARRSSEAVAACVETTFAYRHHGMRYHQVGGGRLLRNEPQYTDESVLVDYAFRSMVFLRLGGDSAVVLCIDDIAMKDEEEHDFAWHVNVPNSHSFEEHGFGHIDILGQGGDITDFPHTYQTGSKDAKCLVQVLEPSGDALVGQKCGRIYGFEKSGQTTPKDVYDEPHGEYNQLLSRTFAFTARAKHCRFVVAMFPHWNGDNLPRIEMKGNGKIVVQSPDRERKFVVRLERDQIPKTKVVVESHLVLDY